MAPRPRRTVSPVPTTRPTALLAQVLLGLAALLTLPAPAAGAQAAPVIDELSIPLSDGTLIHACRIAPAELTTDHPVVLEWTNYNIDDEFMTTGPVGGCPPQFGVLADALVADGYVFVAGQTRGVGRSGGQPDFWSSQDGRDGAEVIQWLSDQDWSAPEVGLVGCSSSAQEGAQVAVEGPPALGAIALACYAADTYRGSYYPGGLRAYTAFTITARIGPDVEPQGALDLIASGDLSPAQRPLTDLTTAGQAYQSFDDSEFWRDKSTAHRLDGITAPLYMFGSWADFFGRGFPEWARTMKPADRLMVLPGWHGSPMTIQGELGMNDRTKAWFDHHLRGLPLPYADEAPVQWIELEDGFDGVSSPTEVDATLLRGAATWPPADLTWERWYLSGDGSGTSTSFNDGSLTQAAPEGAEGSDPYTYPVTNIGQTTDPRGFGQPSRNGSELEDAGGALTYTSEPLAEDLVLAGPVTATLHVATTAIDTDVIVRLLSVAPDGSFSDITNGWLKAAYAELDEDLTIRNDAGDIIRPYHPHTSRAVLTPGAPVQLEVELWQVASKIPAGNRLRVFITAQEIPWFIQDTAPAVNQLFHDADHPSSILLPVRSAAVEAAPEPTHEPVPAPEQLPATGGGLAVTGLMLAVAASVRRRGAG